MSDSSIRPVFATVNPATLAPGKSYPGHGAQEAARKVAQSAQAQRRWRRSTFDERARLMTDAAAVLRRRRDELTGLMTNEMGKIVTDGRAEIDKCATACEHFAVNAARYLARQSIAIEGAKAFITFNPLGVVLAVMPWNFPFWQVFRFAAPALMAGNGGVLKHASNVPGCALAIETVFREAGFPEGLFSTVLVQSPAVKALIENADIAAVTLTGSVPAGRSVAAISGAALKKCVLELGGSDAYLILEDADVHRGREGVRRRADGQRRPELHRRQALHRRAAASQRLRSSSRRGDAALRDWRSARPRHHARSAAERGRARRRSMPRSRTAFNAVRSYSSAGTSRTGQGRGTRRRCCANVRSGQPAHDDEVFGPVAAVIEAVDEADAITIANASEFGLGSGVLTRDLARGERIAAEELEAGMSFVNDNVRSDPRMPFGGVKHSGFGRECSDFGIREFVNVKSIQVKG